MLRTRWDGAGLHAGAASAWVLVWWVSEGTGGCRGLQGSSVCPCEGEEQKLKARLYRGVRMGRIRGREREWSCQESGWETGRCDCGKGSGRSRKEKGGGRGRGTASRGEVGRSLQTLCQTETDVQKEYWSARRAKTGGKTSLFVRITESQNGRGWKGPLWVI